MARRLDKLKADFLENGWIVIDLLDRSPLDEATESLLQALHRITCNPDLDFTNYLDHISSDDQHIAVQAELTEIYRKGKHARRIITAQLAFLQEFIGPDISIQRCPYLRIVRPDTVHDNVDFHRDTQYGGSPYELSFFVPFLDLGEDNTLCVMSGSHMAAERDYPTEKSKSPNVEQGSLMHKLGLPYAPHRFNPPVDDMMEPVPLKYGQALLFNLALVHGQKCNTSQATRFSSDIRLVNSLAPINWDRNVTTSFYERLSSSPVSEQALRYEAANDPGPEADVAQGFLGIQSLIEVESLVIASGGFNSSTDGSREWDNTPPLVSPLM